MLLLVALELLCAEAIASHYVEAPVGLHRAHATRFWTLNPGRWFDGQCRDFVNVSSIGIRGAEPEAGKADLTVLLLGDSCIFGAGLKDSETLDRTLEKELARVTGRRVRVFNGGCNGYSSGQGLDLLAELGPKLKPDIVVLEYMYGDAMPDTVSDAVRLGSPFVSSLRSLLWKSSVYTWLRQRLVATMADPLLQSAGNPMVAHDGSTPTPAYRATFDEYAANLRECAALAHRQGARSVVFLLLPNVIDDGVQMMPYRRLVPSNPAGGGRQAKPASIWRSDHSGTLARVGREAGVFVDGEQMWRAREDLQTMFWDNVHFNAAGSVAFAHDFAAALVAAGAVTAASGSPDGASR